MSEIQKVQMASAIEQVVIGGDLSRLNPDQRVSYFRTVCDSLGLNPATKPFEYITLNGKLTLYATRAASEQLRKINGVSIAPLERTMLADAGLYQVVARGRDATGREDEASGVVTITGLKGEALANAMLKCETKAKRRLTLSICGLGFLDETEVSDIPGAQYTPMPTVAALPTAVEAKVSKAVEQVQESPATPLERLRKKAGVVATISKEPPAVSEQPVAAPVPRKGGSAPVTPIPESAPALPEGEYKRVRFKYLDVRTTKSGQGYLSMKTHDNEQFNCWDGPLCTVLEGIGTDVEVDILTQNPPANAPQSARPKIVEVRRVEVAAAQEVAAGEDGIPF
jgi:hypothetical protein